MDTLSNISSLIEGLVYYSESDHPFTAEQWNISTEEIPAKIAALTQSDINQQRTIAHTEFFHKLTRIVDPNDRPLVENAEKAKALYQYLLNELNTMQVTRVEGNAVIPIFITGILPDKSCLVLRTTAVET